MTNPIFDTKSGPIRVDSQRWDSEIGLVLMSLVLKTVLWFLRSWILVIVASSEQ